jgi:hypothetical protein
MKQFKLFSSIYIFLILICFMGMSDGLNSQTTICKITFCNCCGDSTLYDIYTMQGDTLKGSFWTKPSLGGCTDTGNGIANLVAWRTYYVMCNNGNEPLTYFTACPCLDGHQFVDLPCCGGDDNKNIKSNNNIPEHYKLEQNLPNPFNPSTTISFEIPEDVNVTLTIYDVNGRVIEKPFQNNNLKAGLHRYIWNTDHKGLSSGIYFYKLEAGNFSETKKMILMK